MRLVDTHDHVLSTYDRQIAIYATDHFQRQGIELVMGCRVCLPLYSVFRALFFMHLLRWLINLVLCNACTQTQLPLSLTCIHRRGQIASMLSACFWLILTAQYCLSHDAHLKTLWGMAPGDGKDTHDNQETQGKMTPAACAATQVNEVQPGQVVVTDAPTNTKKNVEFGTCIWTTGIKMHPLVGKLAKTLPQGLLPALTPCPFDP